MTDPKKVLLALRWVVDEMELRYRIFAKSAVRNITSFNERPLQKTSEGFRTLKRPPGLTIPKVSPHATTDDEESTPADPESPARNPS